MVKKNLVYLFLLFSLSLSAQETVQVEKTTEPSKNLPAPIAEDSPIYTQVEVAASPARGMTEFYKAYAEAFKAPNISGVSQIRVVLGFVVEADGSFSEIKVLRDPGYGVGDEAVRTLQRMFKWKPALQKGVAVRSQFTLPITIRLN